MSHIWNKVKLPGTQTAAAAQTVTSRNFKKSKRMDTKIYTFNCTDIRFHFNSSLTNAFVSTWTWRLH